MTTRVRAAPMYNRIRQMDFGIDIARLALALNQCCSETPLKILFQQYRPRADIGGAEIPQRSSLLPRRDVLSLLG
jgi:hypothetical protein